MSRVELDNPATIKRLLPGLRRLALFPARSIATVSTETGCELSELETWVKAKGRPTVAQIDDLEDGSVAARSEPQAPTPANLPAAAEPLAAPTQVAGGRRGSERWAKVVRFLLDHPGFGELAACQKIGIPIGSWGGFKKRNFGLGSPISSENLQSFLDGKKASVPAKREIAKARQAPLARRRKRQPDLAPNPATPPPVLQLVRSAVRIGCSACGGFTVFVRGRNPDTPIREVCPTCLAERLDDIIAAVAAPRGAAAESKSCPPQE